MKKKFTGSKAGAGVYHKIINEIPPHDTYIEGFLGHGAILQKLRPAPVQTIGIEIDPQIVTEWEGIGLGHVVLYADVLHFLKGNHNSFEGQRVFMYLDPPYLRSTRSYTKEKYYRHEFDTPEQHAQLLELLLSLKWMVAISHYRCPQYDQALSAWRRIDFGAQTRKGRRIESLYMNYPEPWELHDYRYLGTDYRQRQDLTRQKQRMIAKLAKMPRLQRYALIDAMNQQRDSHVG